MGAVASGPYRVFNCLKSQDLQRTYQAIQALGVPVRQEGEVIFVEGRGGSGLTSPAHPLEMGNSGTTARLLLGILAGSSACATLTGDASLCRRPMWRVVEPLERMGAVIEGGRSKVPTCRTGRQGGRGGGGDKDHLPLTVRGGPLRGIDYTLPIPSAQVKSAVLFAGLFARGKSCVREPIATRDHTERLLAHLGAKITRQGDRLTLQPSGPLIAKDLEVPGDLSSAAFFLTAAALVAGSEVTVREVGLNPTRSGFLEVLREMGAEVSVECRVTSDEWEPRGDVMVRASSLKGVCVGPERIPGLIDELPILMVAATQARGQTRFEGTAELRVKETDRVHSMVSGLSAMGGKIGVEGEAVVLQGPTPLRGAAVDSLGDHRTAMALAVAGLLARGTTTVQGSEWIDISYPGFEKQLEALERG